MPQFIKSNSCLIATDSSPAFATGERLGIYFLGLAQDFSFETSPARSQLTQLGSQEFAVDSINFSPDIVANISYLERKDFYNNSLLGMVHKPSGDFQPIFKGANDFSSNLYFFFSDLQGYDLIEQIKSSQSFSGVNLIAVGNAYLTNANISYSVGVIPNNQASFVCSNIESCILTGNSVQLPAINLQSGNQSGVANLFLNPLQLDRLETGSPTGFLQNVRSALFSPSLQNLQIPNQKLTTFQSSNIRSIDFSLAVDRENSYGFGSDYVFERKIKFPVRGALTIGGTVSNYESGDFSSLMTAESKQNIEINFRDEKDLYLSGLSNTEFVALNETGHIVKNRTLRFDNCSLNKKSESVSVNGLLEYSVDYSFAATENGGYSYKQGDQTSLDDFYLRASDLKKLFSSDGYSLITDPFCRVYGTGCEVQTMLSNDGYILCTRDNFVFDGTNPVCYLSPNLPSGVFALYLSLTDGSSGSYIPFMGFPTSGQNGGTLESGVRLFYNYSPSFAAPNSGELLDSTPTGVLPDLFYRLGSHRFKYSGGYGMYDITYNMDSEQALSAPSITGSGYVSNVQVRLPFTSGNHHTVEFYKSADGTGQFTGINFRGVMGWDSPVIDVPVTGQSIYYYRPVGIRGGITTTGQITGYPNPRTRPSGLSFDEGFSTFNEEGTLRWATGMRPAQNYSYNIYRSLSGVSPFSLLGSTTGLSYTDTTMVDPGIYVFRATVSINGFESPTGSSAWTWIEAF